MKCSTGKAEFSIFMPPQPMLQPRYCVFAVSDLMSFISVCPDFRLVPNVLCKNTASILMKFAGGNHYHKQIE